MYLVVTSSSQSKNDQNCKKKKAKILADILKFDNVKAEIEKNINTGPILQFSRIVTNNIMHDFLSNCDN